MEQLPENQSQQFSSQSTSNASNKSFLIVFLLSLFFGIFGVDRFYLGYKLSGILKLITLGLLGIWSFIDQVLLLTNNLKAKNGSTLVGYKQYRIFALILFIVMWGGFEVLFFSNATRFVRLMSSPHPISTRIQNNNNPKNTNSSLPTTTVTKQPQNNIMISVPTKQYIEGTGAASGFTLRLTNVVEKPTPLIGDKPGKNLQYIEFDISVTNNTKNTSFVPGVFYFQDADTGDLFMPADVFGYVSYNWIISTFSQKHVIIPNKKPLMTTAIPSGQTVNNLYLIYQMLPAEKGKIVWDTMSTITPVVWGPKSPKYIQLHEAIQVMQGGKLKLFELHATNSENGQVVIFTLP